MRNERREGLKRSEAEGVGWRERSRGWERKGGKEHGRCRCWRDCFQGPKCATPLALPESDSSLSVAVAALS